MRIRILFVMLIGVLWLWSGSDAWATPCADGQFAYGGEGGGTGSAGCAASMEVAKAALIASKNSGVCNVNSSAINDSAYFHSGPTYQGTGSGDHTWTSSLRCLFNPPPGSTAVGPGTIKLNVGSECAAGTLNTTTGECESDPVCDASPHLGRLWLENVDPDSAGPICMTGYGDGCLAVTQGGVCSGSWCRTTYRLTDEVCAGGEGTQAGDVPGDTTQCVTQAGQQVCAKPTTPPKTVVEGNEVDLDSVVPDGCFQFSSGDMICGDSASSPPAPDNGVTPGTTATPDHTVTNSTGDTVNYYNNTTVNNSSGPAEGTDPSSGSSGDGEGDGDGECDGSECEGELPGGGELEEVAGFGELAADFLDRVENSPIISAISGMADSMPAGSCEGAETAGLAVFGGESLTIDAHCTIWAEVASIVYAVMLAAWCLLGGIIILRA